MCVPSSCEPRFTAIRRSVYYVRVAFLLLIGMLIVACNGQVPAAGTPLAPISHIADASELSEKTVALVARDEDGDPHAFCSGVWMSKVTIVTAAHCVADLKLGDYAEYVVRNDVYASGDLHERTKINSHRAQFYARDADHDLALLSALAPPSHTWAQVSMEPVRPGMPVQAVGMPLGLWYSYSRGDVAAMRYLSSNGIPEMLFIQTTAPISGGNSGCGLFDAFGELVGIAHATFTRGQNVNLFISAMYVDGLVKLKMVF